MIYLRPLNIKDLETLYKIKSNPNNLNKKFNNFDTSLVTKENIKTFLINIINEINAIRLGICLINTQELIGSITIGNIDYIKSICEINIYIDENHQNKGYGKYSLNCLINYIYDILKLNSIVLEVHKENFKAINLYKKIGFIYYDNNLNQNEFIKMKLNK